MSDPLATFPFNFVHHHHHHEQHPTECSPRAPLRRKVFRKKHRSIHAVSGGGGGGYSSDSDSTESFQYDYSRNKRQPLQQQQQQQQQRQDGEDEAFALILQAAKMLDKKEECSSHDEVETVVGEDQEDSSGDETIHAVDGLSEHEEYLKTLPQHLVAAQEEEEEEQEQPRAPPLSPASSFTSTSSSSLDNRSLRSEFISGLVDFADELISSIWQKPASELKPAADSVIPMRQFIQEVLRRSQSSYGTLSLALYYLGRASRRPLPQHLRGKSEGAEFPWCKCSRRMFLAALILATKFLHDRAYTNRAWAKLAGLTTREVGLCESALLDWLNWELYVHPKVFIKWQSDIFKRVRGNMSYLSSAEGSALLGMLDPNASEMDSIEQSEDMCLQMLQVSIEERVVPQPVPPKVNTTETYLRTLAALQQQRTAGNAALVDAKIQSVLALMQSQLMSSTTTTTTTTITTSTVETRKRPAVMDMSYISQPQVAKRTRVM